MTGLRVVHYGERLRIDVREDGWQLGVEVLNEAMLPKALAVLNDNLARYGRTVTLEEVLNG